jgi:hypothetical protein
MSSTDYNGWANWETWCMALRLHDIRTEDELWGVRFSLLDEVDTIPNELLREFARMSLREVDWEQLSRILCDAIPEDGW